MSLASLTGAERRLILAKSLGTMSAPVAAAYGLDAIWLTPLFFHEPSITAIADNAVGGARQLLVGGLADPSWDPVRARALGCEVVDYADTTHFVNVPGDVVRTAEIHVDVTRTMDAFIGGLAGGS